MFNTACPCQCMSLSRRRLDTYDLCKRPRFMIWSAHPRRSWWPISPYRWRNNLFERRCTEIQTPRHQLASPSRCPSFSGHSWSYLTNFTESQMRMATMSQQNASGSYRTSHGGLIGRTLIKALTSSFLPIIVFVPDDLTVFTVRLGCSVHLNDRRRPPSMDQTHQAIPVRPRYPKKLEAMWRSLNLENLP